MTSPWAHQLEAWLDQEDLLSLVPEGSLTCQGSIGHPSLIDHIFVNLPFLTNPFFPATCLVSFNHSISSDYAALFIDLPLLIPPPPPLTELGWKIEDQMKWEWMDSFALFPHPLITDISSLTRASNDLLALTNVTCGKFFTKKMTQGTKGLAWWNDACAIAAADVSHAYGQEHCHLSAVLHATLHCAKRDWLKHLITDPSTSIWDMAKWRKGR